MRSCLLIFLIVVFILLLPGFLFLVNIGQTLTPAFIKKELASSGAIDDFARTLPDTIAQTISSDGSVNKAGVQDMLSQIPNEDIRSVLDQNIENNLNALANPESKELIFDISRITSTLPNEVKQAMKQQGQEIQDKYVFKIPYQIRIYRYVVNNLQTFKLIGGAIFATLLLLIGLCATGWRTKFRALSLSFLVPGLFIFIPFVFLKYSTYQLPKMNGVPETLNKVTGSLFNVVKVDIANLYVIEGFTLLALAIILFVLSLLFQKTSVAPLPQTQTVSVSKA